jgi:hypothetical protein
MDQRPVSLEEYNSQVGADQYMQMIQGQVPNKPMDITIVDQMVVGRQTAGIPQRGRINHGPNSVFKWENDPLRSAVDERVRGETQLEEGPKSMPASAIAQLPGLESVSL